MSSSSFPSPDSYCQAAVPLCEMGSVEDLGRVSFITVHSWASHVAWSICWRLGMELTGRMLTQQDTLGSHWFPAWYPPSRGCCELRWGTQGRVWWSWWSGNHHFLKHAVTIVELRRRDSVFVAFPSILRFPHLLSTMLTRMILVSSSSACTLLMGSASRGF